MKRPASLFNALVLLLVAHGSQALSVRDDLGTVVSLPEPARRIVTLSPHATDLVMATGAAGRLVSIAGTGEAPDGLPRCHVSAVTAGSIARRCWSWHRTW